MHLVDCLNNQENLRTYNKAGIKSKKAMIQMVIPKIRTKVFDIF